MRKWTALSQPLKRLLLIVLLSTTLVACEKAPESNALMMPEVYAPAMGSVALNPRGQLILVSFFDYTSLDARKIFPDLLKLAHTDSNIRFISRVLPMLGADSAMVARLSIASQFQGKQMRFNDELLMSKKQLTRDQVLAIAKSAGLDIEKLEFDVSKPQVSRQIDENISIARRLGIQQVPAYVVAYADEFNNVESARLVQGNVSVEQLEELLDEFANNAKNIESNA